MTYDFKCTKCKKITTLIQSIKVPLPKQVECEHCKEKALYDWSGLGENIIIPDKFKATSGYVKLDYTKLPQKTYY